MRGIAVTIMVLSRATQKMARIRATKMTRNCSFVVGTTSPVVSGEADNCGSCSS